MKSNYFYGVPKEVGGMPRFDGKGSDTTKLLHIQDVPNGHRATTNKSNEPNLPIHKNALFVREEPPKFPRNF